MNIKSIALFGLAIVLFALWFNYKMPADPDPFDLYCQMVQLNKSNPHLGWPDYKNIYKERCECDE